MSEFILFMAIIKMSGSIYTYRTDNNMPQKEIEQFNYEIPMLCSIMQPIALMRIMICRSIISAFLTILMYYVLFGLYPGLALILGTFSLVFYIWRSYIGQKAQYYFITNYDHPMTYYRKFTGINSLFRKLHYFIYVDAGVSLYLLLHI